MRRSNCLLAQVGRVHQGEQRDTAHGEHRQHHEPVDHIELRVLETQAAQDDAGVDERGGELRAEEAPAEKVAHGGVVHEGGEEDEDDGYVVEDHEHVLLEVRHEEGDGAAVRLLRVVAHVHGPQVVDEVGRPDGRVVERQRVLGPHDIMPAGGHGG